jgi:hypothetical protein
MRVESLDLKHPAVMDAAGVSPASDLRNTLSALEAEEVAPWIRSRVR